MLLFRVVSTPGVRKSLCLSVYFSAVPFSGGKYPGGQEKSLSVCTFFCRTCFGWSTPPPLWGHICVTPPVHRPDTAPPFSRHIRTSSITHHHSSFLTHPSSFLPYLPMYVPKKRKNVTTLLPLYFWNVGNPFVYGLSATFGVIQQGF